MPKAHKNRCETFSYQDIAIFTGLRIDVRSCGGQDFVEKNGRELHNKAGGQHAPVEVMCSLVRKHDDLTSHQAECLAVPRALSVLKHFWGEPAALFPLKGELKSE